MNLSIFLIEFKLDKLLIKNKDKSQIKILLLIYTKKNCFLRKIKSITTQYYKLNKVNLNLHFIQFKKNKFMKWKIIMIYYKKNSIIWKNNNIKNSKRDLH